MSPPRQPWLSRPELNLILLGLVALMSCGLLWWGNQLWWQSYATYVPATDNLRQARHDASLAFLLQGKREAGEAVQRQEIMALLESADQRIADMLSGESSLQDLAAIPPTDALRQQIREYQKALAEFALISQRLLEGIGQKEILVLHQHNAFHSAEQLANRLETELVLQLGEKIRRQQQDQRLGLALWLAFLTLLFLLMVRNARAEASLNRQKKLMEAVVHGSDDAIFVKDLEGRYELFNEGAARIIGKPAEEVLGRTDAHIFNPETATMLAEIDRNVLAGGKPHSLEERLVTSQGEEKVFWVVKGPLIEIDGRISGLFGISRDITEQKRAEAALSASEARLRAYIENAPLAVWVLDEQGHFHDCNPESERLLGFPREALLQLTLLELAAPAAREHLQQQFRQLLWKGRLTGEFLLQPREGKECWLQLHAARLADNLFIVYGWDISERLEKDRELETYRQNLEERVAARTAQLTAAEAQARLLLESTADGLYGIDLEGCLTFINPAACSMLGYPPERLLGRPIHYIIHGRHADGRNYPGHDCPIVGTLQDGHGVTVDNEVYWHADGHPIPVLYSTHPMVRDGRIVGAVVSFMDITERRALEEARESARREAERLARIKSDFLANMSHEIRTPLNGILGLAQIGFRDAPRDTPLHRHFSRILDSGRLLLGIVNDILDFSKIEAGKLQVESTPLALRPLLENALALVSDRATEKGLQLELRLAPDLPAACQGDPLRLGQILANLLSNAIKFTEQGSIALEAECRDGLLELTVRDTGIGMTVEQQSRLFQAFEQADSSITRKYGGTGLGLAITRSLVELLGGAIRVDSAPGQGSSFRVSLPCQPAALPCPREDRGAREMRLEGMSILVAEDNEINRLVLEDILTREGARLSLAGNGLEVLERLAEAGPKAFQVVLMDVQMPEMDGFEATRQLLQQDPELPVIGQTAHALEEDRERCRAAGMVAHIAKPLDPETLVQLLLQHARPAG